MTDLESATDTATAALRLWILDGLLSAGQRINQDEVAARLRLSRVPVREALRRLESDGLVVFNPRRGAVVAPMSERDIEDIYSVRIALEATAAQIAVPVLGERKALMRRALDSMAEAGGKEDWATWLEQDRAFHFAIYAACELPRLVGLVAKFWDLGERYRRYWLTLTVPERLRRSTEAHERIMDACLRGDGATAAAILADALDNTKNTLIGHTRKASALRSRSAGYGTEAILRRENTTA